MARNSRCTVIIDSVLANSKKRSAFLLPVHAMFRHDCPLAVKPASTLWRLVQKKKNLAEILYLLICSFMLCLSWLLRSRFRKFRWDLWITLCVYIYIYIYTFIYLFQMKPTRCTLLLRIFILNLSTCFGQLCAHHQENLLYLCDTGIFHCVWVAVWSAAADSNPYTVKNTSVAQIQ